VRRQDGQNQTKQNETTSCNYKKVCQIEETARQSDKNRILISVSKTEAVSIVVRILVVREVA